MYDQAQTLRKLVRDCLWADAAPSCPRPAVLLVAGAKGGVGTTSVAVNLAVAFQQLGWPAMLVDADPAGGDIALLCRLDSGPSLAEVLAGSHMLEDALRAGPGGIQILAGCTPLDRGLPTTADPFGPRWIAELSHVAPTIEVIVVDAGSGPSAAVQALWGASDAVLLVTAPDPASVVNGYALLKLLRAAAGPMVYCLVNRVQDAAVAGTVFGRIHRASRRFLGLEPRPAGFVPEDRAFAVAEGGGAPPVLGPAAVAARARLIWAASAVSEGLQAARAENYPLISCQERLNLEPRSDRYTRTLSVAEQPLNYAD